MGNLRVGYGSQWHLMRYLAYHRNKLNRVIEKTTGGADISWIDFPFNPNNKLLDEEWKGVDFLPEGHLKREAWVKYWPQSGNVQNWDAVGRIWFGSSEEWLLVEAKAHLKEIESHCKAKGRGGLEMIEAAFRETKEAVGVDSSADWLKPYYQYANRLATQHFLTKHDVPVRLLFIYFLGDKNPHAECPSDPAGWEPALDTMYDHLGLTKQSEIKARTHKVFLPVYDAKEEK